MTDPFYDRAFMWQSLYMTEPLRDRAFMWQSLYVTEPLYNRAFMWQSLLPALAAYRKPIVVCWRQDAPCHVVPGRALTHPTARSIRHLHSSPLTKGGQNQTRAFRAHRKTLSQQHINNNTFLNFVFFKGKREQTTHKKGDLNNNWSIVFSHRNKHQMSVWPDGWPRELSTRLLCGPGFKPRPSQSKEFNPVSLPCLTIGITK